MRKRFVIGNWKLNGGLATNAKLLEQLKAGQAQIAGGYLGVCVPYPYLPQAAQILGGTAIMWGSQDVSRHVQGAYTGEVSAAMVAEFGSRLAIVGHSERRILFADDDSIVSSKFGCARKAGLVPVLCVGETLLEREAGRTKQVVARQVQAVIAEHGVTALSEAILAYEPVWAIGTGKNATPAEAQAIHAYLRSLVAESSVEVAAALPILYGGSVKPGNAKELFAMPDIDGGLIGGASLVAEDFMGIWQAL